jgi:DNA invertase Pin-like site-specific DNA recombinase
MGRGDELISPEIQKQAIRALCERENLEVLDEVSDLDMTGRESKRRHIGPLIDRVRANEIDGIAVYNIARWGRNTWESLRNIDSLHQAGGFIISASENLDEISTPMGRFTLTQYAAIAQLQSDQIGQSWRDTHEFRRSKGLTPTGGKRWGYIWDKAADPQYTPDPALIEQIRDAYASYISGVSFAALVRRLRLAGAKTADGAEFTTGNLRATMDSGFAAGLVVRYKRHPDKGHAIQDLATNEYERGQHEEIISQENWASYLAERRTRNTAPRIAYPATRVSGLVRCASCGGLMSVVSPSRSKKDGSRYLYFACNRRSNTRYHESTVCSAPARIPVAIVESAVLTWAEEQVRAEASPEEVLRRAKAAARARNDTKKLESDLRRMEKQHAQLTNYLLDGTVTADTYKNTAPELERRIADAQVRLTRARDAASAVAPELDADAVALLARAWESTDADVVRDALAQIIGRIEVQPVGKDPRVTVVPRWAE